MMVFTRSFHRAEMIMAAVHQRGTLHLGVSKNRDTPKYRVHKGKSICKWMRTGGTPSSGNLHLVMGQLLSAG